MGRLKILNRKLGQEFETKGRVTPRTGAAAKTKTRTPQFCY
jgi:hypothetical protein